MVVAVFTLINSLLWTHSDVFYVMDQILIQYSKLRYCFRGFTCVGLPVTQTMTKAGFKYVCIVECSFGETPPRNSLNVNCVE